MSDPALLTFENGDFVRRSNLDDARMKAISHNETEGSIRVKIPKIILLAAVVSTNLLFASEQVRAETVVAGIGMTSCAQIIRIYDAEPITGGLAVASYLSGFFAGLNVAKVIANEGEHTRDIAIVRNVNAVESSVRRRCAQSPNDHLWPVALDWYLELPEMAP